MAGKMVCLQFILVVLAEIVGSWLFFHPQKAIQRQIAFYRRINWKIEPISRALEIRNTRLMGAIVSILGIIALMFIIIRQ